MERRLRSKLKPTNDSWRVDETYMGSAHETCSIPLTEYCRVVLGRRRGARRLEDFQRVVAAAVG
jgi:transposase-like protein